MIVALSLNPSMDKSASVDTFSFSSPNRIRVERVDLGGKGVNVVRSLRALGREGLLVGSDFIGSPVAHGLREAEIPHRLVPLNAEMRTNMKIRETRTGRAIEINEQGAQVTQEHLQAVEETLLASVERGDWVALCGSLPPGVPADIYAVLCEKLRAKGCYVAVDSDGEALRYAAKACPTLIKPNAREFQDLTGVYPLEDEKAALDACRALVQQGVGMICLSLGKHGALLVDQNDIWRCDAAQVEEARGTQGAGDTMLAALMMKMDLSVPNRVALHYATAASAATVIQPGTLLCEKKDVERLLLTLPPTRRGG